MTLPKNIIDAILAYSLASDAVAAWRARAALEAAIAAAIQQEREDTERRCIASHFATLPVEPPTFTASAIESLQVGCTAEQIAEAKEQHRIACRQLDRLHDEREVWRSERKELRQRVVDVGKVEPPTDAEVEAWGTRMHDAMLAMDHSWGLPDGEACKPFGVHEQHAAVRRCITEAVALIRRARATGSLERLRELVQKEADNACEDYSAGLWRAVELIDEERGAGR